MCTSLIEIASNISAVFVLHAWGWGGGVRLQSTRRESLGGQDVGKWFSTEGGKNNKNQTSRWQQEREGAQHDCFQLVNDTLAKGLGVK